MILVKLVKHLSLLRHKIIGNGILNHHSLSFYSFPSIWDGMNHIPIMLWSVLKSENSIICWF